MKFDANRFIIDSHRGAFKEGLLENSIPAFDRSYEEGANVLECDLRLTNDGEVVLIHNSTINHVASSAINVPETSEFDESPKGKVKNHTLSYLKALKYENHAELLSLPELLGWMNKRKMGAQLELKSNCGTKVLEDIEEAKLDFENLLGPVVITSFNWWFVRKLQKKAINYDIPLYDHDGTPGLAFGFQAIKMGSFYGKWVLRKFKKLEVWGGMTHYRYMPIQRLDYAHKCGIKFCPRVPDDEKLIFRYLDAGVDGFETDNVPLIRSCCEKKGVDLWPAP